MQVRPRQMHIQRLNLAVWEFNCIVACAPHMRQPRMNAEAQYLVSGFSVPSKPIPQPVSSERGHGLGVTRKTVKVKRVSCQPWVTEENTILELWDRHSAFYFCLNLSAKTHFTSRALRYFDEQTSMFVTKSPLDIFYGKISFELFGKKILSPSLQKQKMKKEKENHCPALCP